MLVSLKLTACVGTCIQHACRFPQLTGLIRHLEKEHALLITISHHTFSSHTKFLLWKSAEEECSQANYVQATSTKSIGESTHTYFYCNRSGVYKTKCEGKRLAKSQGSCKVGEYCISHMKMQETSNGVVVEHCETHHNHYVQLSHLRVPDSVADKLAARVPITRVLNEIRETITTVGREHLMTRQDVFNIHRAYNIEGVQKHKNDQTSIHA